MSAARIRSTPSSRPFRLLLAAVLLATGVGATCARSVNQRGAVHILTADAEVNPVLSRYIDRGLDDAERSDAQAVVIKLDTPGGLSSPMQDFVQRIQSSKVPVIVYVVPGGRAASAGTFITMSAHIAAMGPGARIGAAHPINSTGGDIEGTLGEKVENDAAAYARSIAQQRGRNVEWAESAVRDSVSATTSEAVDKHIVDFEAVSLDDLLAQAAARTVDVDGRTVALAGIEQAPRVTNNMTLVERLLLVLSDPNIAFLLLSLGGLGLLIELIHPGVFAPGVFGVIALILAFLALGTLPVNWAGVALIGLAFILFAAEVFVSGFGALGIGGALSLIAGGLILTSGNDGEFRVSRWLVVGMGIAVAAFFAMIGTAIMRMRRMPPALGVRAMIGQRATARSYLDPDGFVFIRGERWKAVAEDAPIAQGAAVEVTGVKGLTLTVRHGAPGPQAQPLP